MPLISPSTPLPHHPLRVLVAGNSGAGKTTLAHLIAEAMGGTTEHVEIDSLFHGPNWQPRSNFVEEVDAFSRATTWVTEWSYTSILGQLLADRADLMVWLDLPKWQVALQVLQRTLKRRVPRPQQLWNGNVEPPLHTFFTDPDHVARYAIRHHSNKRRKLLQLAASRRDLLIIHLRSHREASKWLSGPFRASMGLG